MSLESKRVQTSKKSSSKTSSTDAASLGIQKIRVFKSGDPYHSGIRAVVNTRKVHDLDVFLAALTERIQLPFGVKKLFTTNGKLIKHIPDLEDGQDYVASSNIFVPLQYGHANSVRKPRPSRSVEPSSMKKETKKKKKRVASVAADADTSEVLIPLNADLLKKKKLRKKKTTKEVEHKQAEEKQTTATPRHKKKSGKKVVVADAAEEKVSEEEKETDHEEPRDTEKARDADSDEEKERMKPIDAENTDDDSGSEKTRSVSRYENRTVSRARSRMSHRSRRSESEREDSLTTSDSDGVEEVLPSESERSRPATRNLGRPPLPSTANEEIESPGEGKTEDEESD